MTQSQSFNRIPLPDNIDAPDAYAEAHSRALRQNIISEIKANGPMPFDRFMELALYAPGLGYYTAGSHKIGAAGDFVTAPEISPVFSQCLANQCAVVLKQTGGSILEFGAGSGVMAADILKHLEEINCLPEEYLVLDLSPDLKQRQLETIKNKVPEQLSRVRWLEQLPENFRGVMLGNEVLDAMPVSLFYKSEDQVLEQFVDVENDEFKIIHKPASEVLKNRVEALQQNLGDFLPGYESEINLRLDGWIKALSDSLDQGAVILIDYGYARHEYYHPERGMGTLICHYQHKAHDDPLKLIGLQDITANVDFSAVKEAGLDAGLELAGYTTQAAFLMANGLDELVSKVSPEDTENFLRLTQGIKVLMLPSEMGDRFKVLALSRGLDRPLQGFTMRDFSDRL